MALGRWYVFLGKNTFFFFNLYSQALENREDIEELSECFKDKKVQHELLKENDTSGRGTPASELDGRGHKPKKGKAKVDDYENSSGSKRKRRRGRS